MHLPTPELQEAALLNISEQLTEGGILTLNTFDPFPPIQASQLSTGPDDYSFRLEYVNNEGKKEVNELISEYYGIRVRHAMGDGLDLFRNIGSAASSFLGEVVDDARNIDLDQELEDLGEEIDLPNPDNSEYINVLKDNYVIKSGAEWKKEDGTTFKDSKGLNSSSLCDASNGDCEVELYVNWQPNIYKITLNKQSGSGGTSTIYER